MSGKKEEQEEDEGIEIGPLDVVLRRYVEIYIRKLGKIYGKIVNYDDNFVQILTENHVYIIPISKIEYIKMPRNKW